MSADEFAARSRAEIAGIFFEQLEQPAVVLRKDGAMVMANTAYERHFGAWQRGQPFGQGLDSSSYASLLQLFDHLVEGPASFVAWFHTEGRSAQRWTWQWTEGNNLICGQARQIASMPESDALFSTLFNSGAIGILLLDASGVIQSINESMARMLGYGPEDLQGQRAFDLVHKNDQLLVREQEAQLRSGKLPRYQIPLRLKKRNQRSIWVTVNVLPFRPAGEQEAGGEIIYLVSAQSIDRQVRSEHKLRQRAEALARTNLELEQFAFQASHDLQQPLRTVSNFVQLLQRKYGADLDDEAQELIHHAIEGSRRMQRMIRDLLTYSRTQRADEDMRPVNVNEVLQEVNTNLQELSQAADADILSAYLPGVTASRSQLAQLFQNLIENALKFRHPQRRCEVIVSAKELPGFVQFCVQDNGLGIAPEYREKVFSLFERLHDSEEVEGSGIGLAVCRRIVEHHGGKIWVESDEGNGSRFLFNLRNV